MSPENVSMVGSDVYTVFPIEISSLFVGDMLVLGSVLDRQYTKASGDTCKSIPIAIPAF